VFVQRDIDGINVASAGEVLLRQFCQLNDDLAALSDGELVALGKPVLPSDRDRAALVGAAFSYRYAETKLTPPAWLNDPGLIADELVCLVPSFQHLIEPETPAVVRRHNVLFDAASFESV